MNTLLKTVSAAALGFVASAGLAAAQDDTLKIGMTFQEMNNPYFVSMQEALNEAAAQIGAEVIVTDAGHDVAKQISDVEDMLQQGIDILLLNPTDSAGVESAEDMAVLLRSMGHQAADRRAVEQVARDAAEDPFAQARVAIGAGDDQVRAFLLRSPDQRVGRE